MIKTRLVKLLSHTKKYIVQMVLWQWIALLGQIAAIFSIGRMVDCILMHQMSDQVILTTFMVLVVAVAIRFLCDQMATRASFAASVDVKRILREKIYEKLLCLGASYREHVSTSEVVQMSTEGVEQLEIYFGKYLPQLFYSILAPVTLFIILSFINLKASAVLLICVPLIPISIVAVQKLAKKLLNKYWGLYTTLGDSFLENLQGMTTLKIYQADEMKAVEMDEEAQNFRKITMKVLTMQLNSTSVMDIIAYGGAAVGMITAIHQYIAGNIAIGGALIILLLASEFFIPLRLLGSFFHIAMNGMAASDKIFGLLDLEEGESGESKFPQGELEISLDDVHFAYEKDREILKGITMNFPANSFISFVGESGCGKSTLAGILTARNRGYTGSVKIGGVDISDIMENELMSHMTKITHNSYLFAGTVKENLRMAKPDASKEEMEEVLEKVNLLAFLKEQDGLQTVLSERGENFSGGQRQRVALGRAIVREPQVFLLDEPLSNLDAKLRAQMRTEISKLHKKLGTTFIYVTHDQTEAMTMGDRIVVMKDGYIQQIDTPTNLYNDPVNQFVAGFIGSPQMNFIDAKLLKVDGKYVVEFGSEDTKTTRGVKYQVTVPESKVDPEVLEPLVDQEVVLGVRPECIHDEPAFLAQATTGVINTTVEVTEMMGAETYLYLNCEGIQLTARVSPRSDVRPQDELKVAIDPNRIHIFDKETEKAVLN